MFLVILCFQFYPSSIVAIKVITTIEDPSSIDAIKVIATIEEGKINQF